VLTTTIKGVIAMDKNILTEIETLDTSQELNYFCTHICQALDDLEKEWVKNLFFKNMLKNDPKINFIMKMKNKWINLYLKKQKRGEEGRNELSAENAVRRDIS
jgi:hypothetical protein